MLEEDETFEPNYPKKVINGDVGAIRDTAIDYDSDDVCQKPCCSSAREDSTSFTVHEQRTRNYSDSNSLTPILKSSLSKGSGSLQRSPRSSNRKKVVSFSSEPTEKKISSANDCLSFMQIGSNLIKVKSATRRYQRYFSLESDFSCLRWSPTMKKVDKARIAIDSIKEIRIGRNTENLRNSDSCFEEYTEDCAFSIIWGDDYQHLDLIANTPDEANIWITGLVALTSGGNGTEQPTASSEMTTTTVRDKMLEKFFDDHLQELEQCEDDDEKIIELLLKLNPRLPRSKILHKQKEFEYCYRLDGAIKASLRKREFCEVYRHVSTRPEIYFLLVRYANKDYLTADDLQIFLETEQGIAGATIEMCHSLIKTHEPFENAAMAGKMTVDGFNNYLLSPECHLFDQPVHGKVCQDMTQPFTNYFISCSNNTYLAEDQLKGPSSVQAYINALKLGCRFIELDVWESEEGTSDEPVVCHGHTMTSKLPIRKALSAIKQYAFYTSQYPLIVQIENHLNIEYQRKFAFLLQSIFGDLLYIPKNDANIRDENQRLPAPESFKNKILLKGKRLDEDDPTQGQVSDEDESAENNRSARAMKKSQSFVKRRNLCKELSDLICPFLQSFNVSDFPTILDRQKWYQLGSLNESFALKLSAHYSQDFVIYTQKFLTRVYPNSVRIDSSNMNPQEFWNCGCQLVALNFQTPGLMMDLARGKFSANGRSGYVLKPLNMRDGQANFSPRESLNGCSSQVLRYDFPLEILLSINPIASEDTLHIKIISAQQLRRPRGSTAKGDSLDPFVIVEVFGLPCDCAEERTKTVQNDSFNPVFDESFQFDVSLAELALVRFLVLDDDYIADDFIGQYTIPFDCLQSGYRHFTLLDINGEPMVNSTLFVHVAVTNKRGGGKPKKRGVSVRRKYSKIQTGIKQIGIKRLDDAFKQSIPVVTECIQLRTCLENELTQWQESCGLGPAATMRQGLRLLHSRVLAASNTTASGTADPAFQTQFLIDIDEGFPRIELEGNVPDILRKSCQSFEKVIAQCRRIIERSDALICKVEEQCKRINDCYQEVCNDENDIRPKGQQATRASENFAWNCRLLKSQTETMEKILEECKEHIKQINNTACLLNVLKIQCQQPCQHRTQQTNNI